MVVSLLGRNRILLFVQGGAQRVPAERGALHAGRELSDAREGLELPEILAAAFAGHHRVVLVEHRLDLVARAALYGLRHQRGGGRRDRAAEALELEVVDRPALHADVERELVAAERVV